MEFSYRAHEAPQEGLLSPPDSGSGDGAAAHLTAQQARNLLLSYGKDMDSERAALAMQLQKNMDIALIEKIVRNTVTKILIEEQVRRQMALQRAQENGGGGGGQAMDFGAEGLLPTPFNDAVDFGEFNDQPSPQQLGNKFYGNAMHRQNKTNLNYSKGNPNSFKQENMQNKGTANYTNKPILPLPNQMKQDQSAFENFDQNPFASHEGKNGNAKLSGFKRKPEEEGELEEEEEEEQGIFEEHIQQQQQQQQPRGLYMGNQMHGGAARGRGGGGQRGGGGGGGGRLGHVRYTITENLEDEHGAQSGDHGMVNNGGGFQGAGRGGGRGFGGGGRGRGSGGGRAQFGGRGGGRGGGGGRFQKGASRMGSGANQTQLGGNLGLGRM